MPDAEQAVAQVGPGRFGADWKSDMSHDGTHDPRSTEQAQPNAECLSPETLSRGALLRAGADGELTPAQARALADLVSADPEASRRMESERLLRAAIGRAVRAPATPAGLRDRVAAAMASLDLDQEISHSSANSGGTIELEPSVPEQMAPSTRQRSFWSSLGSPAVLRRVGAIAAVVLLTLTAGELVRRAGSATSVLEARASAVDFVAEEHGRCLMDFAPGGGKFSVTSSEQLPGFANGIVGREIGLADLLVQGVQNLTFVDAGECGVPAGGKSMHLRFDVENDAGEHEVVSLFVQAADPKIGLDEGVSYLLDPASVGGDPAKSPSVYLWLRDGLAYYLVIDNQEMCDTVRQKITAPAEVQPLSNLA
jgi:anti-sigma factor RsiW